MPTKHCHPREIENYLLETLEPTAESRLLTHIEECSDCRKQLEAKAADESTWHSAKSFLTDAEHDSILLSSLAETGAESDDDLREETTSAQVQNVLQVLAPTDDPHMLGRLGPYEISGVVGSGGMGVVLKGHDPALDRVVAIKVLAPHLATSGAARRRFAREAKAAAAVLHPNVMAIHSVDNEGALPYLVMPFLRGSSLQNRIDNHGPLSTIEILRVTGQIAAGLAAAHTQGLVHRDIKPANIMLTDGLEQVAITDFGLARAVDDATMTRSGVIAGTPQYMSPEQARGCTIDERSDLFSLGSLMYAMCTGHSPFRAETSFGVLRRITDEKPRDIQQLNAEIPCWLSNLTQQLLAKQPSDRIQTARQVETLVSDCLAHAEQPHQNPLPACLVEKRNPARTPMRWLLFAAATFSLACVGLFAFPNALEFYSATPSSAERQEETPEFAPEPSDNIQTANSSASPKLDTAAAAHVSLDDLLEELQLDIDLLTTEIEPENDTLDQFIQSISPLGN